MVQLVSPLARNLLYNISVSLAMRLRPGESLRKDLFK